jgi:hypothetical protein
VPYDCAVPYDAEATTPDCHCMERYGPHGLSWHDIVSVGSLIVPFIALVSFLLYNWRDEQKKQKEEADLRRDIPWNTPTSSGGARQRRAPSHADIVKGYQ